jgi:hypothetical protein
MRARRKGPRQVHDLDDARIVALTTISAPPNWS